MDCTACGAPLAKPPGRVLGISVEVLGDEVGYAWRRCAACGAWTEERVRDRFLGPEERSVHGPIDDAAMQRLLALLPSCPAPWDKRCDCPAHRHMQGA